MFYGRFKSTIGNRNSYLNKELTKKINPEVVGPNGWGTLMKRQIKIGKHWFGYLTEHDPDIVVPGTMIPRSRFGKGPVGKPASGVHVVGKGDSLWKIARKYGTTVDELKRKNGIKNGNFVRVGQKIKL